MTRYVVLQKIHQGKWSIVGSNVEATTTSDACELVAEELESQASLLDKEKFVAVPETHWRPKDVVLENVPKITVSDESSSEETFEEPETAGA